MCGAKVTSQPGEALAKIDSKKRCSAVMVFPLH
jgi:hypothetical protein